MIENIIDSTLEKIKINNVTVPFFCGVPNFDEEAPETYIFYTYYDMPENYSGDDYNEIACYVTITYVSSDIQTLMSLTTLIRSQFKADGFKWISGNNRTDTDSFPEKKAKYQEFLITMESD